MLHAVGAVTADRIGRGETDWTGIISSGGPKNVPNWAADAPDRLAPGVAAHLSPPAPFAQNGRSPLTPNGSTGGLESGTSADPYCVTIGCVAGQVH